MTGPEILDTAVVGAGPYGLSVAAHAKARGSGTRVFGTPMRAWAEHMPVGMKLKSEPWASHLSDPRGRYTLKAYCHLNGLPYAHGLPTPVQTFADYGRWFRQQTAPDLHETDVLRVDREGPVFGLELADGSSVRARAVVLAVGFLPFPRIPEALAGLEAPRVLHSSAVNELSGFGGKRVAVVGAGQSAVETAALLDQAGAEVTLVARAGTLKWNDLPGDLATGWWQRLRYPDTGLGPGWYNKVLADMPTLFRRLSGERRVKIVANTLGPAGSWWLRERFEKSFDAEHLRTGTRITSARSEGDRVLLELSDGRKLEADHVVAATGYEVDVRKLTVLGDGLRGRVRGMRGSYGPPDLGAGFQTSVPGLSIVGLAAAATFGPSMRFVFGSAFASRTVAARLPR
ncbi:SidA/IucD/PvdA family monooxygenase [Catenulispora sp. NF23]|uniref:FAD-dependent oxidoreductase n=1 Tax=Catenulispora pinistramenti TaxID=2705254 RepID=UPI001BA7B54B|nr:FAD-dependent oxidoreductase [Catenulispora pinistramenti]MBS2532683.1 SidA/IucD/PvdA family monooxygenase [Catenulispora pinistramenti]